MTMSQLINVHHTRLVGAKVLQKHDNVKTYEHLFYLVSCHNSVTKSFMTMSQYLLQEVQGGMSSNFLPISNFITKP